MTLNYKVILEIPSVSELDLAIEGVHLDAIQSNMESM